MLRPLFAVAVTAASLAAQQFEPQPPAFAFLQQPPRGLPPMPAPVGYTPTAAMCELGKDLFHDGVLSKDRSVSCASCHPATTGFAHPDPKPPGIGGQKAARHAPALWNRGYGQLQRWDGSTPTLEQFVLEPIGDPKEMGHDVDGAVARLNAEEPWRAKFTAAFGGPASPKALQQALATFVRGIVAGDAPYDRFLAGDPSVMTPQQRHGQWIFESKGGCWKCHTPPLFTDEEFHATGVGAVDGEPEAGHAAVTADEADRGKWKTPTLRAVRLSAPYMHDGSQRSLDEVVEFYARGGNKSRNLDSRLKPLDLSAEDKAALVAFLKSL
ncbi:MAG: cytochrome-c peroxidase [Planctomycetes bacterium]|nr:cytochrome-c peroxidase [Planctomycetota bacterium]